MDKKAWGSQQNLLRSIILKSGKFDEAIELCLNQHEMVHSSEMSQKNITTCEDELWQGLDESTFRTMLARDNTTIAWCIWHSTRIEDITMNILVADGVQVINTGQWIPKMNNVICDTGNAMTNEEIVNFSTNINMNELRKYRIAVGKRTCEIIRDFSPEDLKRKIEKKKLKRVIDEGAVLDVEGANWLIDFWGKKNVAGILLMPVTRHHMVHLNESLRIKKRCQLSHR
ncbi:DinB family protein [Ruminiclostridium papyrosolvens]|uniref:DinB-like domain-containing protein n=1 Tax=Ruminiclostridium papyrosolvens C7 TaxID=1330534 RepID=U4QY43_9FIRM|nr:DinB family protein [Ruminiclostridium papyrosolvens]EPR09494.1 hypothetical protein L323_15720 [Ruminiclostridium papyrosolvens C7]